MSQSSNTPGQQGSAPDPSGPARTAVPGGEPPVHHPNTPPFTPRTTDRTQGGNSPVPPGEKDANPQVTGRTTPEHADQPDDQADDDQAPRVGLAHGLSAIYLLRPCPDCSGFRGLPPAHRCDVCQARGCMAGDNTSPCEEEAAGTCGCPDCWEVYQCWCGILCPTCERYVCPPPQHRCRHCADDWCRTQPPEAYPCDEAGRATCGCPRCWTPCDCPQGATR